MVESGEEYLADELSNHHCLVGLMDYHLEIEAHDIQYDLGWIEWDTIFIFQINEFLDEWYSGKRRNHPTVIDLGEINLVNSEKLETIAGKTVHEITGKRTPLDGISFHSSDLKLPKEAIRSARGFVYCNMDTFFIQAEIPELGGITTSIFRSRAFSYWKINHLLGREDPV